MPPMADARTYLAGGAWIEATANPPIPVVNPANGAVIGEAPSCTADDVDRAVAAARAALPGWAATPVADRLALLSALREALAARGDELALLITRQMGTPIGFSRAAQIGLPLRTFDVTIAAMAALEEEHTARSRILRDPAGVVAAITPWNFPLHQIAAKVVPALAAGCTVVLKPSEITPLDARIFAELVEGCGFPAGVFNMLFGAAETGAALVAHPQVDMVSFTGSTAAGRHIGAQAGRDLKKVALELGGKSANILLDDADLSVAVPQAIGQCFVNGGQTCAALTRLIVPRAKRAAVEALAVEAAARWLPGDPEQPSTRLGPLSSLRQRERVAAMVARALEGGATALIGGTAAPEGFEKGAWFAATVLSGVTPAMEIAREEVFGPVLVILDHDGEEDAIAIANDSAYGLSGGVWSADPARAERVAARLRTGQVMINGAMLDMEAPFGGVGQSGIGREYGRYGLEEYFNLKAITGAASAGQDRGSNG